MSRKAKIGDTTLLRFSSRSVGDVAIPFPERGDSCGHTFSSITACLKALQALRDELGVQTGQKVFISGGAGGVGTFAVQIAKWLGAHVTTTASKRGEALVRSLGCDEAIDYTVQDISTEEGRFDAGFDLIGGKTPEQLFEIMNPATTILPLPALPNPQ